MITSTNSVSKAALPGNQEVLANPEARVNRDQEVQRSLDLGTKILLKDSTMLKNFLC